MIPDPLNSMAYNKYMYVYGNPLKYEDPSGHDPFTLLTSSHAERGSQGNVFFYKEVGEDNEYKLSIEFEFSPNDLIIKVKSGMLYFVCQYI